MITKTLTEKSLNLRVTDDHAGEGGPQKDS